MARRKISSRTGNIGIDYQSKHEKMISEMHSALYALGDKVRTPMPRDGEKLLPSALREQESPDVAAAKAHVERLHGHFKASSKE